MELVEFTIEYDNKPYNMYGLNEDEIGYNLKMYLMLELIMVSFCFPYVSMIQRFRHLSPSIMYMNVYQKLLMISIQIIMFS